MNVMNNGFARVGLITAALLLIPLVAMRFTHEVSWTISDFVIMGALCIVLGSLFVVCSRFAPHKRLLSGVIFSLVFLSIWAELAVGVFTNLGS